MATPLIWMPLNGNMDNLGIGTVVKTSTAIPAYYVDGKIGKAYNLNVRSVFTCEELSGLTSFSICFWVKMLPSETQTANWQDIVCFYDASKSGTNGYFRWESGYGTSSSLHGAHWHDNATNAIVDGSFTHFTERNVWHHCAVTVENGVSLKSFTDGMLKSTITTKLGGGHLRSGFHIGETNVIEGVINDLRVYDHALSAKEVHDISKALVLHFPLDNNGGGGENLLKNSSFSENTDDWSFSNPATGDGIVTEDSYRCLKITGALTTTRYVRQSVLDKISGDAVGTLYTISADVKIKNVVRGTTNPMCEYYFGGSYNNGGTSTWMGATTISGNRVFWSNPNNQWVRHIWVIRFEHAPTSMTFSVYSRDMTGEIYVRNIKMERGSIATEWSPASEDNVVYDCSGFHNDAILNNITFNTDTPRYDACSEFTSSKYSYVKVTDNKWMAEKAPELTINLWCYVDDWESLPSDRLFSCTEGGGFNVEPGNSGYLRFPNSVYTTASGSITYKYSSNELKKADLSPGWHMLTFIKNLEGNKVYVDGEFHSSYNFVNYGEHFNLNARLFLGCEASTGNPSSPYYTGKMSDFRLYYTELLPEDIKELYEVGASIDNLQNMHTHWYIEDPTYSNPSITKTGIVKESELEEADKASLFSSGKVTAKEIIEI